MVKTLLKELEIKTNANINLNGHLITKNGKSRFIYRD